MANEIDILMALDPLKLSAQNIDAIIDYHRKAKLAYASGAKPKRSTSSQPIDLEKLGLKAKPEAVKRRKI
jgi:hypothetical protein